VVEDGPEVLPDLIVNKGFSKLVATVLLADPCVVFNSWKTLALAGVTASELLNWPSLFCFLRLAKAITLAMSVRRLVRRFLGS
jgi:hypothetical protein